MGRVVRAGVVALVIAGAVAAGVAASAPAAGGDAPFRPTHPGLVIAELPGGALRSRDNFARQQELSRSDPQRAAQLAAGLIEQARVSAQPQLYGRAEGVLAPWLARPTRPAAVFTPGGDTPPQRPQVRAA